MLEKLLILLFLALPTATISVTVGRASIFNIPRRWLTQRSTFMGQLLGCPYCLSHWVAFVVVGTYRPQILPTYWAINFLAASFAVVTLTALLVGLMYVSFQQVPAPQTSEEASEEDAT
jgi:hypothetical protein